MQTKCGTAYQRVLALSPNFNLGLSLAVLQYFPIYMRFYDIAYSPTLALPYSPLS